VGNTSDVYTVGTGLDVMTRTWVAYERSTVQYRQEREREDSKG
jgi:hypothetical protein